MQKDFIDRQVKEFSHGDISKELLRRHKEIIRLIKEHSTYESRILDIGCLDGKILKELEKTGYQHLYGTDFSEIAKKSFTKTQVHFAVCDIEHQKLPFKETFDLIIFSDVLEHLFSPEEILVKIKPNLSVNGTIVFSVPNAGWFLNGPLLTFFPAKLFMSTAFGPWGHTHQFTFYETRQLAKTLKFKILSLTGGRNDNYAFKQGFKKITYGIFLLCLWPLIKMSPEIFSDHIFAVFEKR